MSGFKMVNGQVEKIGIWVGDVIVQKSTGKRYKVLNEKRVNWSIQDEAGKQYNLRIGANGWEKAEDQNWTGPKEKTEYEKAMERVELGVTIGTAVKLKSPRLKSKYGSDTYVVIGLPSNGSLKMAKLNGDGGRYLHGIQPEDIEVTVVNA